MSSDFFLLDDSFFCHSSSEILVPEEPERECYSDSLWPFQSIPIHHNPLPETHFLTSQTESFDLYPNLPNGFEIFSGFEALEVKTEEYQMSENISKMMQRSFSSNSFESKSSNFQPLFQSPIEEPPDFHNISQTFSLPENNFLTPNLRRACSTGDLQNLRGGQMNQRSFSSSPLAAENSLMEDENLKVGRYSAEQRKERIQKYRAKRTQRNFNKTIKYACRKTLADNRPRIRGRFARNDEPCESPKATNSTKEEDEDEFWLEGLLEEVGGGNFINTFGQNQFQFYGF